MSNQQVNYKQKYVELKQRFMESIDVAFRLGFEQGAAQGQQDAMMAQQQQSQEQQKIGQGNGAEGSPAGAEQMANPNGGEIESQNPNGSELDQHIAELESMVSKSEKMDTKEFVQLIGKIRDLRKNEKQLLEMKKSNKAISEISKSLNRPAFKIGVNANHNMSDASKKAVSMQEKIVIDLFKTWEEQEKETSNNITKILDLENLIKKD